MTRSEALAWLAAWDSQGWHRTATPGDQAGADWLAGVAASMGARVGAEPVPLDRPDPVEATIAFGDTVLSGMPMFDAPDGVVEGAAGPCGSEAAIGVGEIAPAAVYGDAFRTMRATTAHRALVLATTGGAPGLALLNAESFTVPYGPPVLLVGSEHAAALAAARGPMRVTIRCARHPVAGRNTVTMITGRDASLPPLVVMTPRSGWWTCTSERGGGLVCWLACLRAVLEAGPPARDVVFTANTGHELGHIGLDAFMAARPGWDRRATWLHWGANIGAASSQLSVVSGHPALRQAMSAALDARDAPHAVATEGTVPQGESREIHRAGGQYITLVGSNKLFHLPQDRLPHAVDVDALVGMARAAAMVAVELAGP